MKKVFAICASPRKNGSNAQLLKKALEGAASVGAETEMIWLGDLKFSGCMECYECKKLGSPSYGKCALQDDLTDILERLKMADVILLGTPQYYTEMSSYMLTFLERFIMPNRVFETPEGLHVDNASGAGTLNQGTLWPRCTHVALWFTMNVGKAWVSDLQVRSVVQQIDAMCRTNTEVHMITETKQYPISYRNYYEPKRDEAYIMRRYEEVFPIQLEEAYLAGKRLALEAAYIGNNYARKHFAALNEQIGKELYELPPKEPDANPGFQCVGLPSEEYPEVQEYIYHGDLKKQEV